MKISRDQVNEIMGIMFDAFGTDVDADNFRPNYSGRAMYGQTCIGFVLNSRMEVMQLGAAMALGFGSDVPFIINLLTEVRTDDMGLGIIVYFPNVQLEEEEN